ncbi:MAG: hypothetical protein AB4063_26095 [Crocosphaera sp.]
MSDSSTVTYTTAEILKRIEDKIDSNQKEIRQEMKEVKQEIKEINQKIDNNHKEVKQEIQEFKEDVNKRLTHLEVGQGTLTEKVEGMDKRLQNVEGTQKNQIWALIVIVASAIITGGAKLFFTANP